VTEPTTPSTERAELSRELGEFLVEFSIGVHRYAMYPLGHPSLAPVVENIVGRLAELFRERRTLMIGVAQRQLVIEGVATDRKHPVLADLAARLHGHQVGALSVELGVTATEIEGLLAALAEEPEREGVPLGVRPAEQVPSWEHARLHRLGYERLELKADGTSSAAGAGWEDTLWLGLAQATLGGEGDLMEAPDGASLAQGLEKRGAAGGYDRVVAEYLRRIPRELRGREGAEPEKLRQKVAEFIRELDDGTLRRLVGMGDASERRRFLLDANQSLAVESVVKVLSAVAAADQQTISHSMTRMLQKLAVHAQQGTGSQRSQADTALRENVEALITEWELKDPNPEAYTSVLDAMSRASPVFRAPEAEEDRVTGARRLVEMSVEVDAFGPIVARAVTDLMEEGGTGHVLAMVRAAATGNLAARKIREILTTPKQLRQALASGTVDDQVLKSLVEEMGADAVDPLLDVLCESQDRSVRRRIFDALAGMGLVAGERAAARLAQGPWFVLRNMLALLQRLDPIPAGFNPQPFLTHEDERVRREAFPLALRRGSRDRALAAALSDPDERMIRMALAELQSTIPDAVLPTLVNRVVLAQDRPSDVRSSAIKLLANSGSPLGLNTLLTLTTSGKTLLGRPRVADPSPEVLAALRGLAQRWAERDDVKEVLEQAARSKDPDIRGAVHLTSSTRVSPGGTS